MTNLHTLDPELLLISGKELKQARQQVFPFFLEFCLQRNPLPWFTGGLAERQDQIKKYFLDTFTEEKDLILRAEGNSLTGLALFDPQNWSLEGEVANSTIELVIAASLQKNPWRDKKDFKILIAAYKNYKGRDIVGMNINREWKRAKFKNYCLKLGFQENQGLFII